MDPTRLPTKGSSMSRHHVLAAPGDALQAISDALASAIARWRTGGERSWRVHSICLQGNWAYAYLKSYSTATQAPLPFPSDLALAYLSPIGWQVVLPENGEEYNRRLAMAPISLLPEAGRKPLAVPDSLAPSPYAVGYALPYAAGRSAYAIRHWYPAIDFALSSAEPDNTTIKNAKAGTVVFVKDSSTRLCGDPPPDFTCWQWANVVIIQHSPDEFSWYFHLAPGSIPASVSCQRAAAESARYATNAWISGCSSASCSR